MESYQNKMDNLYDVYKKFEEEEKKVNWDLALGLNSVDDLKPSSYLEELIKKYIHGIITINDLENTLENYYKNLDIAVNKREKECDLVSSRIIDLVNKDDFCFSIDTLKKIHAYLFNGIYDFAGKFRSCNLTKKEVVINNNSVIYADYREINDFLIYDFDSESKADYSKLALDKKVKHFAKFTSDIWQIHPFREGNTRTTAVFMIKYLRSLGYNINNDIFKENSIYFRNALVLSNYYDYQKNITPNFEYLISFYNNLLYCNDDLIDLEKIKTKKLF